MKINYFKPGASEFKRTEHPISLLYKIIETYSSLEKMTLSEMNISNDTKGSMLYKASLENGLLKKGKTKDLKKREDRLTSLFIRQGILSKDEKGYIKLTPMSIKLKEQFKNNFNFMPFSFYDFILTLFTSMLEDKCSNNYLGRAIDILINQDKLNINEFYKKYIIKNFNQIQTYLRKEINSENIIKKFISETVSSGSGGGSGSESISWLIINFFKSLYSNNFKEMNSLLNDMGDLNTDIEKKWRNDLIKTLILESGLQIENNKMKWEKKVSIFTEFIKDKSDVKDIFINSLISFGYYKKESEYKTLVNMYVLKIPLFKVEDNNISINPKLIDTAKNILGMINSGEINRSVFEKDLKMVYEKIVPINEREDINDIKFYPKLKLPLISDAIFNNKIWIDRNKKEIDKLSNEIKGINKDNLPTYYEFLTILYIYIKNTKEPNIKEFSKIINTKLDSNFMPIRHAGAGIPDAVMEIDGDICVLEPTLVIGNQQAKHEFNIDAHAINSNAKKAMLLAPEISDRTIERVYDNNTSTSKRKKKIKIIPISHNLLKKLEENFTLSNVINNIEDMIIRENYEALN